MMPAKRLIQLVLLSALPAASPALADPIASRDAASHIGEIATVKGRVSVTVMPSGEVYLDLDGQGDNAPLSAYVSRWNRPRFGNLSGLAGRTVEISGRIGAFRARPEIFLQDPGQIIARELARHVTVGPGPLVLKTGPAIDRPQPGGKIIL